MMMMKVECLALHTWLPDYQADWIDEAYPADVEELLVDIPDNECNLGPNVEIDNEDKSSSEENVTDA